MTHYYYHFATPAGIMTVVENTRAITGISFGRQNISDGICEQTPLLEMAGQELAEYFSGKRYQFDLPFEFEKGTPFEQRVWQALFTVPYGQQVKYKEIATRIGSEKSSRAVGRALHKNPIVVCFPCHRVVGSNGSLTGYVGGLDRKKHLLDLEYRHFCCSKE